MIDRTHALTVTRQAAVLGLSRASVYYVPRVVPEADVHMMRRRWRDNVFVERLWRSVKYEEVYLHAYETVADVRLGLTRYFTFFNDRRPHQALGSLTPDVMYFQEASKNPAVSSCGRAPKKAA